MFKLSGLRATDHRFRLPLDHAVPEGPTIEVCAREFVAPGPGAETRPWLVFLQGGPGFESPRPTAKEGWIGYAAERYRVLALDQRGTGLSTPHTTRSLLELGSTAAQVEHLRHFRADSIVKDCEAIRCQLLGEQERWTVLGQSFGGFCVTTYLSIAPEGLAGAMITGGLPGLGNHADEVYRRTFPRTASKNAKMHRQFPELSDLMVRVFRRAAEGDVKLPCGDPLSQRRIQTIGAQLGFSYGAPQIFYLFERAFVPGTDELSITFLRGIENLQSFDTNPFYALLHEACYAQGRSTDWSAERVRADHAEFDARASLDRSEAPLLTGEMIFPWMFDEWTELRPLKPAAEALAKASNWPLLYDEAQLANNEVPVSAVVYHDDMFVPADLSLETAKKIRGLHPWVTNEYEHDGLRADGPRILSKLLESLT
ncbi:Proline iminopeptidase [Planctomycetes bacterium Poly30]|uniref:Proline iminopeptidase n=2 Tax=Saltatorellus ferox TaxID=2528018 RepID=A0A518F0E7_9BACT|nr:Proline iminopeptidase [Planctomycetes bacterium Poly30]